jgi:hypothetical protein
MRLAQYGSYGALAQPIIHLPSRKLTHGMITILGVPAGYAAPGSMTLVE